jgi:hypothetical protein
MKLLLIFARLEFYFGIADNIASEEWHLICVNTLSGCQYCCSSSVGACNHLKLPA